MIFITFGVTGHDPVGVEFRSESVPPADSTVLTTDSRMSADDEMAFLERECRAFHLLGVPFGASLAVGVGRSRDCEVRIDDGSVSARHCTLYLDAATGQMHVVDHGSKNGTFVDGRRAEAELRMPARSGVKLKRPPPRDHSGSRASAPPLSSSAPRCWPAGQPRRWRRCSD